MSEQFPPPESNEPAYEVVYHYYCRRHGNFFREYMLFGCPKCGKKLTLINLTKRKLKK